VRACSRPYLREARGAIPWGYSTSHEIDYYQPKLLLPADGEKVDEQPLLLFSAKVRKGPHDSVGVRSEVMEILSFVYCDLYPEGFSSIKEEDDAYRAYCKSIYEKMVSGLPDKLK